MRKSRRRAVASLSLLLTLSPLGVPAQTAAPAAAAPAPAPKPATLADALAAARPPEVGIALAVGADNMPLPKDAPLPRPGATLGEVAAAFGRLTRHFGDVTAVAPPTMTVLNTSPGTPNIYDGMPPEDALKLLCASLTPGQWQALAGERGLGLSDLTGQDQRSLFLALFPGGTLKVQQAVPYEPGKPTPPSEERDLTGDLPQVRVRLARRMLVMLPVEGNPNMHTGTYLDDLPGSPPRYHVLPPRSGADTLYGAQTRAEVPNLPKKGQLDLSAPVLQAAVPLAGVKTVGDLIGRIGDVTRVELYADPHYEKRTLTLVGGATSAPASQLLRALALCVTGAYRQVGPAFVLTDDLMGVGTRRLIWEQFEQEADALRKKPLDEAGDKIVLGGHSAGSLPDTGDGLGITPEQRKAYAARNPGMIDADDPASSQVTLPLAQLTPAQQDAARRVKAQLDKMRQQFPGGRQEATTLQRRHLGGHPGAPAADRAVPRRARGHGERQPVEPVPAVGHASATRAGRRSRSSSKRRTRRRAVRSRRLRRRSPRRSGPSRAGRCSPGRGRRRRCGRWSPP